MVVCCSTAVVLDGDLGVVNCNVDVVVAVFSTVVPFGDSTGGVAIVDVGPVVQAITAVISIRADAGWSIGALHVDEEVASTSLGSFVLSLDASCSHVFVPVAVVS